MDKQMIEEMAKCKSCYEHFGKCYVKDRANCTDWTRAVSQYEQGYRKIPEGAVVLTREEYGLLVTRPPLHIADVYITRKKTAEKFAERLKEYFNFQYDFPCWQIKKQTIDKINEICNELTEVK